MINSLTILVAIEQWANRSSLRLTSINDGFPINEGCPVTALAIIMVMIACKSPSQPAGIPSLFNKDSARHPVVFNCFTRAKQDKAIASSCSETHSCLMALYKRMAFKRSSAVAS